MKGHDSRRPLTFLFGGRRGCCCRKNWPSDFVLIIVRATITRPVVDDKKSHALFNVFLFLGKTACLEDVLLQTELTAIEYDCYPFF
jgi:hypothetical protein